jgi:hypothetical protein
MAYSMTGETLVLLCEQQPCVLRLQPVSGAGPMKPYVCSHPSRQLGTLHHLFHRLLLLGVRAAA